MFLNDLFLENDDDMFAPSKAHQVYQALRNAAQYQLTEYMEMLHANGGEFDKDFAANRIREVPTIVGLANQFKTRGLESGLIEWRELQSQDEDPHFSVTDYMSDAVGEAIGVTLYKLYNRVCLRRDVNEEDDMFAPKTQLNFDITLWVEFHVAGDYDHHNEITEDDPLYVGAVSQITEFLKKYNYEVSNTSHDYTDGGVCQCSTDGFTDLNIIAGLNQAVNICKEFSAQKKRNNPIQIICNPSLYLHSKDHNDVEELADNVKKFTAFIQHPTKLRQLANNINLGFNAQINEEDNDMFAAPPKPGRFWASPPEYYSKLWGELIPDSGAAQTLEGELMRASSRLYYDYYNNGMGNNTSGAENFIRNFGDKSMRMQKALNIIHPFTRGHMPERSEGPAVAAALEVIVELTMRQILAANGNYHPNPGDMFDYSERDDPYPEDEDDDEYEWDRHEDEDDYDDED